jgi:hypothetical protein
MELSGNYFIYSGTHSKKFGLIFANVETDRFTKISGNIETNHIFNKKDKRNHIIGESFEDSPIQFDAEVITDDDHVIDRIERREIERWLFHQPGYRRLYTSHECHSFSDTYDFVDGVEKRLYLNCRFINGEKIEGNGGIIGYKFTVECDSCMAWQDEVSYEYDISNKSSTSNKTIAVVADTDIHDYIYPKVTINVGSSGGKISIINMSDDSTRVTSFEELSPNVTIIMRGDGVNYISEDYYYNFANKNFVRLLSGENKIQITGNVVSIKLEFQNRQYL